MAFTNIAWVVFADTRNCSLHKALASIVVVRVHLNLNKDYIIKKTNQWIVCNKYHATFDLHSHARPKKPSKSINTVSPSPVFWSSNKARSTWYTQYCKSVVESNQSKQKNKSCEVITFTIRTKHSRVTHLNFHWIWGQVRLTVKCQFTKTPTLN